MIVDRFYVKPSGFLAKKRGRQVMVDENGNVTSSGIPGSETMNLPCISDYKSEYRNYNNDQLITSFCNIDTHTRFNVYAQDCEPFAYVTPIFNDPSCGYEEPLPEPGVPSSPFDQATYGLYKYYTYCDIDGRSIRIDILKRSWEGDNEQIPVGARDPFVLSYKKDERFDPINPCEATLSFVVETDRFLEELYTDDERMFKVHAYYEDDNSDIFYGFIMPDNAQEPFLAPPYEISIKATDGLGALKNVTYPAPYGSNVRQSFKDIICFCLAGTTLNINLVTVCNLYEQSMPTGIDDDPLAMSTVTPTRFADNKGQIMNCFDVLSAVCQLFGADIKQANGQWWFTRINELSYEQTRTRTYLYTGFYIGPGYYSNYRIADPSGNDVLLINRNHFLTTNSAYKRVEVLSTFGETPSLMYNGDLELWTGSNFAGWSKYGGINISRVQRQIKTVGGQLVPLDNYAMQFNEQSDSGKWIEPRTIDVTQGDRVTLSFNLGGPKFLTGDQAVTVDIRISIGPWFLYNVEHSDTQQYEWVRQLATSTTDIVISYDLDVNTNVVSISIPEAPQSGLMRIQLFGTRNFRWVWLYDYENGQIVRQYRTFIPVSYTPSIFDNFSISKTSSAANQNVSIDGVLHISEQYKSYYTSPDRIEVLFGELVDNRPAFISPTTDISIPGEISAIQTVGNSWAVGWYEFGQNGSPIPIGLMLAKSILKAHQSQYKTLEGDFKGDNLSILDVYDICSLNDRLFMIVSADFSPKYKEMTATRMVQIFDRNVTSNDYSVPHTPDMGSPAIVQNPDTPIDCVSDSVFQCEYQDEFGLLDPVLEPYELSYAGSSGGACGIAPDTDYYAYEQPEEGVALYADALGTENAESGWYSDGIAAYFVDNTGVITIVEIC